MSILSALDLFGIQPGLTIDNATKFKSIQGFLITLIAIIITIVAALTPVKNWIYRLNPLIVQETKLNNGSTFIGGKENPIYFGIRCMDLSNSENVNLGSLSIEDSRIPQPKIIQMIIKDGSLIENRDIFLDRCQNVNHEWLVGFSLNSGLYCLNEKVELYDRNNGGDSSRLLIQYEREKFQDILYGSPFATCGVSVIYQNTYLDATNYDNFVQVDIASEELTARPFPEFIFQTLTFKKKTYRKTLPLFSRSPYDEKVYSTLDRSYTRGIIKPPDFIASKVPIMAFTFEYSKNEEIYNLKYFEFQDLVSTIGGTFGLIISLLRVFSLEMNKFPMKAKIMNSIFKFYKIKRNQKENHNKIQIQNNDSNKLPDLLSRKSTLKELITSKIKVKLPDRIDIFDLYAIKMKGICRKKLNHRQEFIVAVEEFVTNSTNIENISKLSYIVAQLSNIILG